MVHGSLFEVLFLMEPVEPDLETRTTMRLNVFHESWNHVEHVEHLARGMSLGDHRSPRSLAVVITDVHC